MRSQDELLAKYNTSVPRYTSYPTVPFWNELTPDLKWQQNFRENFLKQNKNGGISLYLHLPFCETLCTYCGCNKKITTNHSVEDDYIDTILKEWKLYLQLMDEVPVIRELHLGGGTPTFFCPENLQRLIEGIFENAERHPD
ncbi:MAG TPA: coproporphyrinogen III oxidase, partial [Hanamia sp.]|nr:coproporphyrinogen III oxidase [Hanamia sp.]